MGGLFSSPPAPPAIPVAPPAAAPATLPSANSATTLQNARAKAAAAAGAGVDNTIGTSPQGLEAAPKTAGATLLGGTS